MNLKLLITDDEKLDREGLAKQLNWKEYSITEIFLAKNGSSALEIMEKNNIDILFTDIKMPIMSGIELAKHAREIRPEIQIVFISGYDDFMYAKMAVRLDAYEYILKPVCTEELSKCTANLVEIIKKHRYEYDLLNKLYDGKGGLLNYTDKIFQAQDESLIKIENEIIKYIKNSDKEKAIYQLECLFKSFDDEQGHTTSKVQYCCLKIIYSIEKALLDFDIRTDEFLGNTGSLIQKIFELESLPHIIHWMHNILNTTFDYIDNRKKSKKRKIVETILTYVESHYKENISLNTIAESMYYTPNYLGNVFKQETNRYFSDFLKEYRIRQAAKLLRDSNIKVVEASMTVGYKDMPTFIKNFKSIYGMNPSEFRKY